MNEKSKGQLKYLNRNIVFLNPYFYHYSAIKYWREKSTFSKIFYR